MTEAQDALLQRADAEGADGSADILTVESLRKGFGTAAGRRGSSGPTERKYAVDGTSLAVKQGELFTILGPSGCGKTTTLRCVAGLERPDEGRITIAGRTVFDRAAGVAVPANSRGLGMVFQSYAIWPHMTVRKNVAFPFETVPRRRRPRKSEIMSRVDRALAVTELSAMADKSATKLSGGQQQRLALARALVIEPPVLLLDEPLSNLDAKLRETMRFELRRLQREIGVTAVYVTHDQAEALALSSRIAVMNEGSVVQVGKPREIYEHPTSRFVADFIGTANILEAVVAEVSGQHARLVTDAGELWATVDVSTAAGTRVGVSIRPESLVLSTGTTPGRPGDNEWTGVVESRTFLGDSVDHAVKVRGVVLRNRSNPTDSFMSGTEVSLRFSPERVAVLPAE